MKDNIIQAALIFFFGTIVLFTLYLMFVIVPVVFYADAKCLRAGYPVAHVTIGLEVYCYTLDGAVMVKVDKLK